jgi:hypothetical protein
MQSIAALMRSVEVMAGFVCISIICGWRGGAEMPSKMQRRSMIFVTSKADCTSPAFARCSKTCCKSSKRSSSKASVCVRNFSGWHRAGFRLFWHWKSRSRGGRPKVPLEIRQLIRNMSLANPLWGAPRIQGELLKLGINVGQTSVAKRMARPAASSFSSDQNQSAETYPAFQYCCWPRWNSRILFLIIYAASSAIWRQGLQDAD